MLFWFSASRQQQSASVATQSVPCLTGVACTGCSNDNTVVITQLGVQQRNVIRILKDRFNPDGTDKNEQDVCCGLCAPILSK